MRLLKTSTSTSTPLVKSFPDDAIPPYAILSHTWGPDGDEVSFQDLQELQRDEGSLGAMHPVETKPGMAKLRGSAGLASRNGYEYIWIDTCCIDKTSSAELSEAINSMFRWYQDADICYAYLSDVEVSIAEPRVEMIDPATEAILHRSRWFTRGWTLQELIAPRDIQFFTKDWTSIGNKLDSQFAWLLEEITGIGVSILRGSSALDEVSVAGKMRWASSRRTTRAEDIAYCLMGIFDVNMPLLYGEGPKAFIRLQEEILKRE
jgi:hypothetical protein